MTDRPLENQAAIIYGGEITGSIQRHCRPGAAVSG
jgi:hypothetical protein